MQQPTQQERLEVTQKKLNYASKNFMAQPTKLEEQKQLYLYAINNLTRAARTSTQTNSTKAATTTWHK